MSSRAPYDDDQFEEDEAEMLDPNDAEEEIEDDDDAAMDSGEEDDGNEIMQEIEIQNDSSAHFDIHKDSIFCIAQHPTNPNIVATGGSEGDDAGGIGYIFDSTPLPTPVLPASYQSAPNERIERDSLQPIYAIEGHTDSINALTFTLPNGAFLLTGGLDGALRLHASNPKVPSQWRHVATSTEVQEINWVTPCPHPDHPNTVALGASDGSVWVYTVTPSTPKEPLQIIQSYFLHTASCTAGAWSADGTLLATVSEDASLYVWDVFGVFSAAGLTQGESGQTVVGLTSLDQRFNVEGGLYSVAVAPNGNFVVVGGAGGSIKVVGLPRLGEGSGGAGGAGAGAKAKAKGGRQAGGKAVGTTSAGAGQAGQILADLQAQTDGIESLAFAPPPLTLLAAGSVDGSIALFDPAHRFAVRRMIKEAHEEYSVVKLEFLAAAEGQGIGAATGLGPGASGSGSGGWLLTSCGMDGVVRRWDTRGGTAMPNSGLVAEWKGHRGEGEGGGVLGFVQGDGSRIVTAGDDGVSLVFEA